MIFTPAFWVLLAIVAPAPDAVVTPLDYFDDGRRHVDVFLRTTSTNPGPLLEKIERLKARCVRVEVSSDYPGGSIRTVYGSGVVLDREGHVLTAGHVVDDSSADRITVTLASGARFTASRVSHRDDLFGDSGEDWAILQLRDPPDWDGSLETGETTLGALAMILGYPDHIGVAADGRMAFAESSSHYLEPIVTLGSVRQQRPLTLAPHAGAVPTGGMSGGPVFDMQGRLLGILVSVLRQSGRESEYRYRIVPLSVLPDRTFAADHSSP